MAKFKTVKVEIPEIKDLPIDPEMKVELDSMCSALRTIQDQVKPLEETKKAIADDTKDQQGNVVRIGLKTLASSLGLPERVLGETWDLRRTVRESSRVNEDRLRNWLLNLGISVRIECPKMIVVGGDPEVPESVVLDLCPRCKGAGFVTLTSIDAANHIVQDCTDTTTSVSWSVYGRDKSNEKERG